MHTFTFCQVITLPVCIRGKFIASFINDYQILKSDVSESSHCCQNFEKVMHHFYFTTIMQLTSCN